jgi:hypothetical protein
MNQAQSRLIPEPYKKLPFYDKQHNVVLPKLQDFMGTDDGEMSKIIGKSVRTLKRNNLAHKEILEKLKPFLYIFNLLIEIADPNEIKRWLHTPLPEWKGKTPMDELLRGNLRGVTNMVERIRAGEGGY